MVVQEPTDTWAVIDTIVDVPADFANQCLIGLTRDGAEWFGKIGIKNVAKRSAQSGHAATGCLYGYS